MASNECKNFHQARRPSYNRADKAREQLLFGNAKVSKSTTQTYLQQSSATEEAWRPANTTPSHARSLSSTSSSSGDSMHSYGDSWFENLNALVFEYHQHKAEQKQQPPNVKSGVSANATEATPTFHGYGDSWFENLNQQRENYERQKLKDLERQAHQPHGYGEAWFEQYEEQWEDWKHSHEIYPRRDLNLPVESDDESCEIGQ